MDVNQFLLSLLHALSNLEFVEKVDLKTDVSIIKGRVILKNEFFLHVYFNEITGTTAFALIDANKRIWGIDFDKTRGWHLHPLESPESHINIEAKTIEEIIDALKEAWKYLP